MFQGYCKEPCNALGIGLGGRHYAHIVEACTRGPTATQHQANRSNRPFLEGEFYRELGTDNDRGIADYPINVAVQPFLITWVDSLALSLDAAAKNRGHGCESYDTETTVNHQRSLLVQRPIGCIPATRVARFRFELARLFKAAGHPLPLLN